MKVQLCINLNQYLVVKNMRKFRLKLFLSRTTIKDNFENRLLVLNILNVTIIYQNRTQFKILKLLQIELVN